MKNIFVVDGNAILYQSYYAFKQVGLRRRDGKKVGAIYGFIRKILSLIKNYDPDNLIVAFDAEGKTQRHDLFEEYKANRKPMPDDLVDQIDDVKKFLDTMKIKRIEKQGFEADDIIGSIADKYSDRYQILIYTPDKDLLQLIDKNVKIIKSGRKEDKVYNSETFQKKYGINVDQFKDYLTLIGDKSDNIPGVKGIGPKTAKKLLKKHGNLENILNKDEIKNSRAKKALKKSDADLDLSKKLVNIKKDLEIEIDFDSIKFPRYESKDVREYLKSYDFNSLLNEFPKKEEEIEFEKYSDDIFNEDTAILVFPKNKNEIEFYSFDKGKYYKTNSIETLLSNKFFKVFLYDAHKYFYKVKEINADLKDIRIMEYWYSYSSASKNSKKFYEKFDIKNIKGLLKIFKKFKKYIEKMDKWDYVVEEEQYFIKVIFDMEKKGLKIDKELLQSYENELKNKLERLEKAIHEEAGEEFNVRSFKQLGDILFEKLGLTLPDGSVKKTKTGYSTNYEVLSKLKEVHPIAQKILDYREAHKIYSTYVKPYMSYLDEKQRLYTYFDYCGTSTGRLSSRDPNLQNIPIKGEWGNKMRKLFVPRKGYKIMSADYSQMELRLLAQFSEDETLNKIFADDRDIHTETAIHLFGMSDKKTRNFAKSINYGIVYGLSPYGLSQQLEIELSEAKDYIERYFDRFQGVEKYINEQITKAKRNGYVSVISKRRRYVRGINSSNRFRREAAERIAVNTPLQGSSAEILKVVMNNIHKKIKNNENIYLVSQIHDELLFEVKEGEEKRFKKLVKDIMEDIPFLIKVKMKVDISTGNNWWEAH